MTPEELLQIKARIKTTLNKRSGIGPVTEYAGSSWDFDITPTLGEPMYAEHGIKTIGLLQKICGDSVPRDFYEELGPAPSAYTVIPRVFTVSGITNICDELDSDAVTNRGGFNGVFEGESYSLPAGSHGTVGDSDNITEVTHCNASCTGLCVGSCIEQCNGCTGCEQSCGTGCANGSKR